MSETAPRPGGGLPVREWEQALAHLDEAAADERTASAQALLTNLEAALEDL